MCYKHIPTFQILEARVGTLLCIIMIVLELVTVRVFMKISAKATPWASQDDL